MKRIISLALLILPIISSAQTAPDTYLIFFSDKDGTPYSLDQPQQFLSDRAIQRRIVQGIELDELDLPVDPIYIDTVLAQGDVQLLNKSKWFNAITIRTTEIETLQEIALLPFVIDIKTTAGSSSIAPIGDKFAPEREVAKVLDYGGSFTQVGMMNGHLLHELSQGEGMLIGVLDSGFEGVDWMPAFAPLRDRNGIVLTRDLVDAGTSVYEDHWHGRSVLSCMAAILESQLIGTAPQADYVLLRTENADSEYIVEEDNWIAGAELADSIGCDVINTSLGYTRFDDPTQDHHYTELNGNNARISIAAAIAAQKGMIPVVSAGNQGESDWYYISPPADAHDILAVGAVGDMAQYAPFSSHGPSADGRVKPDLMAMGWGTIGVNDGGDSTVAINGTSFASPLVAGLVASLWKLHPERTAQEIMQAVRASASLYDQPNDSMGYGIPDFMRANELLITIGIDDRSTDAESIFPNPFTDRISIRMNGFGLMNVAIQDLAGREIWRSDGTRLEDGKAVIQDPVLTTIEIGTYLLTIEMEGRRIVRKVIKER